MRAVNRLLILFRRTGSFSFPAVPPHMDLIYEVELIEFEAVDEVKAQAYWKCSIQLPSKELWLSAAVCLQQ